MKLIWTRNKLPLSVLIRWGLREPVSHVAVVFDEKLVFHSNLSGLHIDWFDHFKSKNEIVYELEIQLELPQEEEIYQNLIGRYVGSSYDFVALGVFLYFGFMYRVFNERIPEHHGESDKTSFLCTEVLFALPDRYRKAFRGLDLSLVSPFKAFKFLRNVKLN